MKNNRPLRIYPVFSSCFVVLVLLSLSACSTSTVIDEYRVTNTHLNINDGERVVIMGRRHAGEYETEPEFIECIGNKLDTGGKLSVMPEQKFLDIFYPWFEPRMAPLKLKRMISFGWMATLKRQKKMALLAAPLVSAAVVALVLRAGIKLPPMKPSSGI